MKSYAALPAGLRDRAREAVNLYRNYRRDVPGRVRDFLDVMRKADAEIAELAGRPLVGQRVLVIGPGQMLREMRYLSVHNDVTGVDLDVVVQGFDPAGYWRMFRQNGAVRLAKTAVRRGLGLERGFLREMERQLGTTTGRQHVVQHDASDLPFPDASFDCIWSHSVFEHIDRPGAVLPEAARVLRPGGVAWIGVHLYTSDSGCHDPRIIAHRRDDLPHWAHLRPASAALVRPNAYLNKASLAEWISLFESCWPGVELSRRPEPPNPSEVAELAKARAQGELAEYTDDELLTTTVVARWRRPP